MKRFGVFYFLFFACVVTASLYAYQTIFNPFTQNIDYVGVSSGAGGINTCGDATHALGFTSTGTFACQNVLGSGTSSLAVSSGSATNSVIISSPTGNIVFDSMTFTGSLQGTTTSFITMLHTILSTVSFNSTCCTDLFSNTVAAIVGPTVTVVSPAASTCYWVEATLNAEAEVAAKNNYFTIMITTPGAPAPFNLAANVGKSELGQLFVNTGGPIVITELSMVASTCPAVVGSIAFNEEAFVDSGGQCNINDNNYLFVWPYK